MLKISFATKQISKEMKVYSACP